MQPKQTNEKKSHNLPSTLTYKGKYFFLLEQVDPLSLKNHSKK